MRRAVRHPGRAERTKVLRCVRMDSVHKTTSVMPRRDGASELQKDFPDRSGATKKPQCLGRRPVSSTRSPPATRSRVLHLTRRSAPHHGSGPIVRSAPSTESETKILIPPVPPLVKSRRGSSVFQKKPSTRRARPSLHRPDSSR